MSDKHDIFYALSLWANHIETGDIGLSAQDAINTGGKTTPLTLDQMKKVIRLRELAALALNGKIKIEEEE